MKRFAIRMNIIDIKFMGDRTYLLKACTVKSEMLEKSVKSFHYKELYNKYRENKDENGIEKAQLPQINIVFYKYVFENDDIPSPESILDLYFELYKDKIFVTDTEVEVNGVIYDLNALKARILRTYPSLVRDFHFYLMLKECNVFDKVTYSCVADIKGTDITVIHNDKTYGISLFTDTKRSWMFKKIKNAFRHKYDENEIRIPLVLENADKYGDVMLYNHSDINIVKERILKSRS